MLAQKPPIDRDAPLPFVPPRPKPQDPEQRADPVLTPRPRPQHPEPAQQADPTLAPEPEQQASQQPDSESLREPVLAAHTDPEQDESLHEDAANVSMKDFIQHAERCPVRIRKLKPWQRWRHRNAGPPRGNTGLVVHCEHYLAPGALLELTIPTAREEQSFLGRVVLVRALDDGFDLGIRFLQAEDAQRIRMVEQICRIELYLCDKKRSDGPFVSHETLTREWIGKFAAHFPQPRL